ncbi:MAG TPA: hypothetical protein EYG06_10120 [Myxococcales bacterium]|nr:hypothetical protein [Myxococcales bacterium]
MPHALPHALPNGLPHALPNGLPHALPNGPGQSGKGKLALPENPSSGLDWCTVGGLQSGPPSGDPQRTQPRRIPCPPSTFPPTPCSPLPAPSVNAWTLTVRWTLN